MSSVPGEVQVYYEALEDMMTVAPLVFPTSTVPSILAVKIIAIDGNDGEGGEPVGFIFLVVRGTMESRLTYNSLRRVVLQTRAKAHECCPSNPLNPVPFLIFLSSSWVPASYCQRQTRVCSIL